MLGSKIHTWDRCLLMETFLYLVTLLVLLRIAHVKYPPLLHQWSFHGLKDLFDLHEVMCLATHGDVLSRKTLECLWNQYDWWSLCRGHMLVKHMWFHYVRTHIPIPVPVLEAGSRLEKRLAGPFKAYMNCDMDSESWVRLCELQLQALHGPDDFLSASSGPLSSESILGQCRFGCF